MMLQVLTYMYILKPSIYSVIFHWSIQSQDKMLLPSALPDVYEDKILQNSLGKMMKAINHFIPCPTPQVFN